MNINNRGDVIYSLCKIDWLMARSKQPKRLYSRTQMEVFCLLHETLEQHLNEHDANELEENYYG